MEPDTLPSSGRLRTATLPRVVRDLWKATASGTLHLSSGDASKRLIFKNGDIVFAATNVEAERLGERLVRAGKIKREVLDLSFRVMERSHERFGKTLVELGWVSPMEMQRAVARQIKDIIYSVFSWDDGSYRFEASDEPVAHDLVLKLHTAEVIYEGARRISDLEAIRVGIGPMTHALELTAGPRLEIPVTPEDGFILTRVKGGAAIAEIVANSPLGEEESLRRLYALLLAGVVQSKPGSTTAPETRESETTKNDASTEERAFRDSVLARYAALQFGNYYDRLGLDSGASGKRIREAYEQAMASLQPHKSFENNVDDLEKRLSKVRRKIKEAYGVLKDPARRDQYDRSLAGDESEKTKADSTDSGKTVAVDEQGESTLTLAPGAMSPARRAELDYLEAKRLYNAGDYFDAIAALNEALTLDPDNGAYHRLLAQWLAQNPGVWETSQQHFERAIELDEGDIQAYLGLAALHEEAGRSENAIALYKKVRELDENNVVARERLAARGRATEGAMKNLFRV